LIFNYNLYIFPPILIWFMVPQKEPNIPRAKMNDLGFVYFDSK